MRDRPIIGLPLFSNMTLTEPNTWVGNAYNPEEGRIYTDVKVTLVSRQQIVLRGCKAWLLCGEKMWTRSQPPPSPAAPGEPIEVKAPAEPSLPDKAEPRLAPNRRPQSLKPSVSVNHYLRQALRSSRLQRVGSRCRSPVRTSRA